jgi:hypothetical protein
VALLAATGTTAALSTRTVEAVDFVVDTFSDDPADGDTLREAVTVANAHPGPDRIAFAASLGPGTVTLQSPLVISDDLELTGGGVVGITNPTGDAFVLTASADFTLTGVTVDGTGGAAISTLNPVDVGGDVDLADVTITGSGGSAIDVTLDGGLQIDDGTVTSNDGGVTIRATGAPVQITSTTITGNGHGLRIDDADDIITFTNLTAGDNEADNVVLTGIERSIVITDSSFAASRSGSGLVIDTVDDDVVLTGVAVSENALDGATIADISGSVTITDSWFDTSAAGNGLTIRQADDAILTNLRATGNAEAGLEVGAVFGATIISRTIVTANETGVVLDDAGGFVSITDSTSADASSAGVVVSNSFATTQIERSTISGNAGPAISSSAIGPIHVVTSTLTGNATAGAAAVVDQTEPGSTLSVRHATVVDNGTLANAAPVFSSPAGTVDHSIVTGNATDGLGPVTFAHSILPIGSSAGPSNIEHDDPVVGPLGGHGGPTLTMLPIPGSVAIDGGDAAAASPGPTDQRGQARVQAAALDIGAVEVGPDDEASTTTINSTTISTTTISATTISAETTTTVSAESTTTISAETTTSAPSPSTTATPTTTEPSTTPTSSSTTSPTTSPTTSTVAASTVPASTIPPSTVEGPSDNDESNDSTAPVTLSNTPPIIQPILARTISAGMETVLPVTLRDADGDPVWIRATANDRSVLEIISISRLTPSGGNALFDHRYEVLVRGRTQGSAVITVVADDGQATASGSSVVVVVEATLPATGSNAPRQVIMIASALAAAGVIVLLTTRRRRHV